MDAFESLMAMLLRHQGYWTTTSFKVELTQEEKREIGRHSSPRWELDLVAYKGKTNELLVVECKSFLDSQGVLFRNGQFDVPKRYKLFADETLRKVVLKRLRAQLFQTGACPRNTKPILCLAAAKVARRTDGLKSHFDKNKWRLFDDRWVYEQLVNASKLGYENDIALVVSKVINRNLTGPEKLPAV